MVLAVGRLSVRVQSNIGIIRAGVGRGLSSTQIQGLIRSTGQVGLRRIDLLQGMRHVRGIAESATRIRSVGLDRFPDPSRFEISRTRMLSDFSFEVRLRGFDPTINGRGDRFITVRSNRNLTPREIQAEAQSAIDEAEPETKYKQLEGEITITIIGAKRRG